MVPAWRSTTGRSTPRPKGDVTMPAEPKVRTHHTPRPRLPRRDGTSDRFPPDPDGCRDCLLRARRHAAPGGWSGSWPSSRRSACWPAPSSRHWSTRLGGRTAGPTSSRSWRRSEASPSAGTRASRSTTWSTWAAPVGSLQDVQDAVLRISMATGIGFSYDGLTGRGPSRDREAYQPGSLRRSLGAGAHRLGRSPDERLRFRPGGREAAGVAGPLYPHPARPRST